MVNFPQIGFGRLLQLVVASGVLGAIVASIFGYLRFKKSQKTKTQNVRIAFYSEILNMDQLDPANIHVIANYSDWIPEYGAMNFIQWAKIPRTVYENTSAELGRLSNEEAYVISQLYSRLKIIEENVDILEGLKEEDDMAKRRNAENVALNSIERSAKLRRVALDRLEENIEGAKLASLEAELTAEIENVDMVAEDHEQYFAKIMNQVIHLVKLSKERPSEAGDLEIAQKMCESFLEEFPDEYPESIQIKFLLSDVLDINGETEKAIDEVYDLITTVEGEFDEEPERIDAFEEASPERGIKEAALAKYYREKGEETKADKFYKRSLDKINSMPEIVHERYSDFLHEIGETEKAETHQTIADSYR